MPNQEKEDEPPTEGSDAVVVHNAPAATPAPGGDFGIPLEDKGGTDYGIPLDQDGELQFEKRESDLLVFEVVGAANSHQRFVYDPADNFVHTVVKSPFEAIPC